MKKVYVIQSKIRDMMNVGVSVKNYVKTPDCNKIKIDEKSYTKIFLLVTLDMWQSKTLATQQLTV